jgi:hypothetical protein
MDVITELEELDADRVDGVESPANGVSFLMLKSLDDEVDVTSTFEDLEKASSPNTADRKKMAASGVAMADGSYPIPDAAHLKAAIHAVGRGSAPHASIRAHIIKRAKALGLTNLLPDGWTSGGASKAESVTPDACSTCNGTGFSPHNADRACPDCNGSNMDSGPGSGDGGASKAGSGSGQGDQVRSQPLGGGEPRPGADAQGADTDQTDENHDHEAEEGPGGALEGTVPEDVSTTGPGDGRGDLSMGKSDADNPGSPAWEATDTAIAISVAQQALDMAMRELAEAGTASKELQDMYAGLQETPQPAPISGSVQTDNSEVLTVDITKEELAELVSSTVTSAMKAAETPAEEETPEESTAPEVEKSVSDEPAAEAAPSTADFAKAVAEAVKEALAPVTARLEVVENQPEAPRVLINASGLGSTPVAVMRGQTGTPADQMVKALGDQIATTTDPARKAQLNNELSRIRLRAFEEMRNAGFPAQP